MSNNKLDYTIDEIQHILDYSLLRVPQSLTDKEKQDIKDNLGIKEGYIKPPSGIPKSDLSEEVINSLNKADSALQEHQSLRGYATETYVANAIEQAITTTLNTEV
jgi:hypothetical protein